MSQPRTSLYKRLTASIPLLVTVVVHVILAAIAGYFVVSEQILGKKKTFEAPPPPSENTIVQKQVEHRLQVARRGGGSASASPVSASRIFSTAENALQLPAMPDLPSTGGSTLSGMGFGSGAGGVGVGSGFGTGGSTGSSLGGGFMSMSFLGATNQKASRVSFVIDVGRSMMDIRKGGFEAFEIIRSQINTLVTRLSPATSFNAVVFGGWNEIGSYSEVMVPATVQNKTDFVAWFNSLNRDINRLGPRSASKFTPWEAQELPKAGLDPIYDPAPWTDGIRVAFEQGADTVFIITGSSDAGRKKVDEDELTNRKRENDEDLAELTRSGLNVEEINKARVAALAKASAELRRINAELKAKNKPPLVVSNTQRIFEADFQAKLKHLGYSIPLDTKGWSNKSGRPIWFTGYTETTSADFKDVVRHVSLLRRALVSGDMSLNIFYFIDPKDDVDEDMKEFSSLATRNGGKAQVLTTQILKEIARRDVGGAK